jgi:membrane-bound serine protease (ClpP class)
VGVALGVTLPFAALTVFLMRLVLRTRSWKQTTGREQLTGAPAEVTEAIQPISGPAGESIFAGMVRMHGELWRAVAPQAIPAGSRVRVVRVTGLTVQVAPADDATPTHP